MARKLRIEYAGAVYHVMNRGDRREPILLEAADYPRFLKTPTSWAGTDGSGGATGATMGPRDAGAGRLGGRGLGPAQERGPGQDAHGGAAAPGDHDDLGVDSKAIGRGHWRTAANAVRKQAQRE